MNRRDLLKLALASLAACSDKGTEEKPTKRLVSSDAKNKKDVAVQAGKSCDTSSGAQVEHSESGNVSLKYFGEPNLKPFADAVEVKPLKDGSVVLLVYDALNAKHLGVYGYDRPTSPTIDQVAKEGILFTNHVSNSSWTRPSFTTIITGLPKSEHKVELEGGWRLEPHIKTLGERFKRAGYRTACFTGNPLVRKAWGFDQGYQQFEDPLTLGLKAFPRDSILVDHAIHWLKRVKKDKPFFLVMFLTSSHPPYRPPMKRRRFLSEVPKGKIIEHPFKEYKKPLPKDDHDRIVAAYDDEVAYMDNQVKKLLDYLKSEGKMERTVLAMTADHGEVFGLHNCYLHAYHMWEPALRVPLILNAPNLPKGVYDSRPYTHVDLAPSLLDFVGIPHTKSELPGLSLVNTLADPKANQERILFSQYNAHGVRRQAIRNGRWKLVHHHKVLASAAKKLDELHPNVAQPNPKDLPTLAWDKERYELYDLLADPNENKDLFEGKKTSKPCLDLMNALRPYIAGSKTTGELTEEMTQALINAGYIRGVE